MKYNNIFLAIVLAALVDASLAKTYALKDVLDSMAVVKHSIDKFDDESNQLLEKNVATESRCHGQLADSSAIEDPLSNHGEKRQVKHKKTIQNVQNEHNMNGMDVDLFVNVESEVEADYSPVDPSQQTLNEPSKMNDLIKQLIPKEPNQPKD